MDLKNLFGGLFPDPNKEEKKQPTCPFTLAKIRFATHPDTPQWCLDRMSRHQCETIVTRVAEHPNTSIQTLQQLAQHPSSQVRQALTDNRSTTTDLLLRLAEDNCADVRYTLAENHNLPLAVLAKLQDDENPYVASRASQTLNRLRNSKYNSLAWLPYFRHTLGKRSSG